ncbi:UDP-glucose:glycoprotein glucosyltransferase 1-like [Saccoglossus kowalevskii]
MSEFLAEESNDYFWNFVDTISSIDLARALGADSQDEELFHLGIRNAQQLLTPMGVKLMKFSLSIRSNSPKIEMFNQIVKDLPPPDDCDCFVEIHGAMTCRIDQIKTLISTANNRQKPHIFNLDHSYPGSNGPIIVVLYGNFGQPGSSFPIFHQYLKNLITRGEITYILRHYVKEQPDHKVRLSGYGVELAIKSTEYKAVDDSQVTEEEDNIDEFSPEGEDDVQGFVFSTLRKKYPDLEDNLKQFRTHLIDSSLSTAPLKIWQLQEISVQAAQRVLSSSTDDALRVMRDVSQNFPTKARSLVKTHAKKEIKDEIRKNQDHAGRHLGLSPGEAMILINGLQIDTDIADPFMLLDLFRGEARLMEGLSLLGLSAENTKALMQISAKSNEDSFAIDVRDHAVEYINDLETDKKYNHWLRSVQDLLRPTFPGMLRQVRKNLFHLVSLVHIVF